MERAVRKVARPLLRDFGELQNMRPHGRRSAQFLQKAIAHAEESMCAELMETRPDYGFVGALADQHPGRDPTRRWIFSAVDGVENYARGVPTWAITLALEHKRKIAVAIIFDAIGNQMFAAFHGGGAWVNRTRLRVSAPFQARDMIIAITIEKGAEVSAELANSVRGIRASGSLALEFAYVAAGWTDGVIVENLDEFDRIGLMILAEAGGYLQGQFAGGSEAMTAIRETGYGGCVVDSCTQR